MQYIVLAVILAVIQAPPPVPHKAPNHSANGSQAVKRNGDAYNKPAVPAVVEDTNSPKTDEQGGHGEASPDAKQSVTITKIPPVAVTRDWVDYTAWGFTALLVLVGGIGVAYAFKTVKAVEKQGDLIIASERAWISIKTDMAAFNPTADDAHYRFYWRIKNTGKSVAKLISTDARCLIWNGFDPLPDVPEFGDTQVKFNGRILAPDEAYQLHGSFEVWEAGNYSRWDINTRFDATPFTLHFLAFGRVRYQTFGQDCESNFVEDYIWVKGSPIPPERFRPRLQAPSSYTKHT